MYLLMVEASSAVSPGAGRSSVDHTNVYDFNNLDILNLVSNIIFFS